MAKDDDQDHIPQSSQMDVGEYVKYYRGVLTPQECDYIIGAEDDLNWKTFSTEDQWVRDLKWKPFSYDVGDVTVKSSGAAEVHDDKQKEIGLHQQQNRYKAMVKEDHFLYDIIKSAFEKVVEKYSTEFPLLDILKLSNFRINRYSEGGYMCRHLDTIIVMDKHHYGRPQVSALLYINDDYEGGEFGIIDKIFKPEAGSALIFPSNFMFPHESKVITKGKKWSIVTWLM